MNSKTTKIKKSKVFEQFVDAVNHREFDNESYEQVAYWLSQFTDGSSDEDLYYLHSVIDLINQDILLYLPILKQLFIISIHLRKEFFSMQVQLTTVL
jgi:hypothetical protein